MLSASGLTLSCSDGEGWTRVLVEKPFGKDLATARELDRHLSELFKEEQIFRIDHYLAKEAMQNILFFRFANPIFTELWHRDRIASIEISLRESMDVSVRGDFYDGIGALRDVGQNHLLAMLALVAMDEPKSLEPKVLRRKRADVIKSIAQLDTYKRMLGKIVRGQYIGFVAEEGVAPQSQTETYFRIETSLKRGLLKGVPVVLESGKALDRAEVKITIAFKELENRMFLRSGDERVANKLTITIQPEERIGLSLWLKSPGFSADIEEKVIETKVVPGALERKIPDAYEKVIYDAVLGDQTLFASTDEVIAAWRFITPIIEGWGELPLHSYEKGSAGPDIVAIKRNYGK
jgi:glucose-6-phosphate 1-dehydrogenase